MAIKIAGTTVVDDNRALTNIASVDATTVAALGAAGVGGGGSSVDLIASGTLANGDTVIVNADGTVSVVEGASEAIGTKTNIHNNMGDSFAAIFDSANNKVIVAHRQVQSGGYPGVNIGTISGTSITFGSETYPTLGAVEYIKMAYDSSNNKIVIGWKKNTGSDNAQVSVGTVSGSSISWGSVVDVTTDLTFLQDISFDSSNNKILILYRRQSAGYYPTCVVGTVSGTSISFGTPVVMLSSNQSISQTIFDTSVSKFVFTFSSYYLVGTISGTSISFSSQINTNPPGYSLVINSGTFDSSNNKIVFICTNYGVSPANYVALVGSLSGNTITFGTPVEMTESTSQQQQNTVFDNSINRVIHTYRSNISGSFKSYYTVGTVSGTSISFATPSIYLSVQANDAIAIFDPNVDRVVSFFSDDSTSNTACSVVFKPGYSNSNGNNFLGFSDGAYSNSQTATIQLVGAVNDAQSGLTAGGKYYVQSDGTLSTTAATPEVYAGLAVAATKIIVKG
jgi:hypothetical protein